MQPNTISQEYPPLIDPTRTPLAYGRDVFHQLSIKLNSTNLTTRHRALRALSDILHDSENSYAALKCGLAHKLTNFLSKSDDVTRWISIECLFIIAGHPCGREFIISNNLIPKIADLVDPGEFKNIRKLAHGTFERVSKLVGGAEKLIESKMIPKFVQHAEEEVDEIRVIVLDTLHNCLRVNTALAIEQNAINIFLTLLKNPLAVNRFKAARNLMDLAVSLEGKNKAVDQGSIPILLALVRDDDEHVRAYACAALMLLTVITKGKFAAVESKAVDHLIPLLGDKSDHVQINALKCLTCLAEVPSMRELLLTHRDKISLLTEQGSSHVSKVAKIAEKVISWTP